MIEVIGKSEEVRSQTIPPSFAVAKPLATLLPATQTFPLAGTILYTREAMKIPLLKFRQRDDFIYELYYCIWDFVRISPWKFTEFQTERDRFTLVAVDVEVISATKV